MAAKDPGSSKTGRSKRENEQPPVQRSDDPAEDRGSPFTEDNDVTLEVPTLNIEELELEVEELRAHISARAELVDFLNIGVGVDVYLDNVKLQVQGLEAQLQLKVKLERILGTIDRALDVMANDQRRPRGLTGDSNRMEDGAGDTSVATERRGIGEGVANEPEEAVQDAAPGDLSNLPIEEEYVGDDGTIMGIARDESGNLVEGKLDDEGNVVGAEESGGEDDVRATDAARKKARTLGVDLGALEGSGQAGRILVKDVEQAAR